MPLFRVLRAFLAGFRRFVWVYVGSVLCVACVALYACGVRRIKGLWRVCPCFYPFAPMFAHLLCSLPFLLSLYLPDRVALSLCLCGSLGVVIVSFSLSDYTQKERARRVGASSLL